MNAKSASRTRMVLFLTIALGLTYLMGIPLYFGYASGADVNVFPLAQMMYPAAGVMLGYLITRRADPDLPRGFFVLYLLITAVMVVSAIASVAAPQLPWLLISNFIVMGGSIAAWVGLALTKHPKRGVGAVQIGDKLLDSALIAEGMLMLFLPSLIGEDNVQPLSQECHFPESSLKGIVIVDSIVKNFLIRKETYGCSRSARIALPDNLQLIDHLSPLIALPVDLPLMVNGNLQPLGQSVYHRSSNPVETAGNFVSPSAKFSARMEDSKDNLHRRYSRLVVDAHRNSPAVVLHSNGIARMDGHMDFIANSCQGLIHRIVHDFIYQMMKPPGGRAADIHTGTLPDRFQPLQNLNLICSVFCTHVVPPNYSETPCRQ